MPRLRSAQPKTIEAPASAQRLARRGRGAIWAALLGGTTALAVGLALIAWSVADQIIVLALLAGAALSAAGAFGVWGSIKALRAPPPRATADEFLSRAAAAGPGSRVCIGCRVVMPGPLGDCPRCRGREPPFPIRSGNDLKILEAVVRSEQ